MKKLENKYLQQFSEFDNHKNVVEIEDKKTGLHGFISVHNTSLGSAVGGTRMFPYASREDALRDALRLSRAMTYKCALAHMKHGGGKGVIIGDPAKDKTDSLLLSYAENIDALKGEFSTGEDVGISEENVQLMLTKSPFFLGKSGQANDPSPFASLSTFFSIKAALGVKKDFNDLSGITVAVKGLGKVGEKLVRLLLEGGATITGADINESAVKNIQKKYPSVKIVSHEAIHKERVDVYAPCALGNEFSMQNIDELQSNIICGAANNQLASPQVGDELYKRGIVYVPDYIANAGGLIDVADELETGGYNKDRVLERIANVHDTVTKILKLSKEKNSAPNRVADEQGEKIFQK